MLDVMMVPTLPWACQNTRERDEALSRLQPTRRHQGGTIPEFSEIKSALEREAPGLSREGATQPKPEKKLGLGLSHIQANVARRRKAEERRNDLEARMQSKQSKQSKLQGEPQEGERDKQRPSSASQRGYHHLGRAGEQRVHIAHKKAHAAGASILAVPSPRAPSKGFRDRREMLRAPRVVKEPEPDDEGGREVLSGIMPLEVVMGKDPDSAQSSPLAQGLGQFEHHSLKFYGKPSAEKYSPMVS